MSKKINKSHFPSLTTTKLVISRNLKMKTVAVLCLGLGFVLPQTAFASCDMAVNITNQTPSFGSSVAPGGDISFQVTIAKKNPLGSNVNEPCGEGDRLVIVAEENDLPGNNPLPVSLFPVTSVNFGDNPLTGTGPNLGWSRPNWGYQDGRYWGIMMDDIENAATFAITEITQQVTIHVESIVAPGTYLFCFGLGLANHEPDNYTPGESGTYVPGYNEDGRLKNNSSCRKVVVAPAGSDCCCDHSGTYPAGGDGSLNKQSRVKEL